MIRSAVLKLQDLRKNTDWKLLIFLILFLNVKSVVKIIAIALIYIIQFDFKFGFRNSVPRLPLFYVFIIVVAIFNWLITKSFMSTSSNIALLTGISIWLLCILVIHQLKLFVDNTDTTSIYQTIIIFFLINALLSFINFAGIVWETGALNPYRYQGEYQKYFIRTGDYIKGITFDTSTANSIISAFGVIFFLVKRNWIMLLICMLILLATASNIINMLMIGIFGFMFFYRSNANQKSFVIICLMMGIVFMVKVSPENYKYVKEAIQKMADKKTVITPASTSAKIPITEIEDNLLTPEERKHKIAQLYLDSIYKSRLKSAKGKEYISAEIVKPKIEVPDINTAPFQSKIDTTLQQRKLLMFMNAHKKSLPLSEKEDRNLILPGKIIAFKQTFDYLHSHPEKILTGDGMGNFSSRLAFRTTGLGISGNYPTKYASISPGFLSNHLDIYLYYFSKRIYFHSLINSPNSVYNQLLSEYGIIGISIFAVFYFGFFWKHYRKLTYGIPLLLLMGGVFFIDYWFEQLSVVILFELLLLLNIKEAELNKLHI